MTIPSTKDANLQKNHELSDGPKISQWGDFANWEKQLGGLKIAVIVIGFFVLFMILGTVIESYQGTEFANRIVYKRWYFILVQFLMFLSVIYAMFLRLPFKKRLAGFYVVHIGLILVGIGSVFTYIAGIDGQITLLPNTPAREVVLSDDIAIITYPQSNESVLYRLPYKTGEISINESFRDVTLKNFLPFAEKVLTWRAPQMATETNSPSSFYKLSNPNVSQDLLFSLHPEASDLPTTQNLGPLSVHYFPEELGPCFNKIGESKILVWDTKAKICFSPEEQKINIQKTKTGKRFLAIKRGLEYHSFFPDFSPFPLDKDLNFAKDSPLRAISLNLFEGQRHLFLMGPIMAYFHDGAWYSENLQNGTGKADLPWMGFELELIKHSIDLIPFYLPQSVTPIQQNGSLIKGNERALSFEVAGQTYWATQNSPVKLTLSNGQTLEVQLNKETLRLPYELVLSQFKMETDPGTQTPASYESFVKLFDGETIGNHHIFMNNPLKYEGLTFYQASYFPLENNSGHGSVLSVNMDPGRSTKYAGSLFVVLGAIWHFGFKNRKSSKNKNKQGIKEEATSPV